MIQYGAVPVFVDVTIPQYNIDVTKLEEAYSPKTKAVMIAHTLGNPFDLKAVKEFCHKHNLWLVEDNCDALGSRYTIDGNTKFTGTIGDIGTSSFYPPHHMTMGEGGAVYTDNPLLNKIIRSFRDWGRDCVCPSGRDNLCGHRFDRQYGEQMCIRDRIWSAGYSYRHRLWTRVSQPGEGRKGRKNILLLCIYYEGGCGFYFITGKRSYDINNRKEIT